MSSLATDPVDPALCSTSAIPPARVGYVVKMYPRFSETFIVREILAREERGDRIAIASLRAPRDARFHEMISKVAAPVTWIPRDHRGMSLWPGLARLRELGVRLDDALMDVLLDEDAEVAAQALHVAAWAIENELTHLHAHFATVAGRTARLASAITGLPWTVTAHAKDIFHIAYDEGRRRQVIGDAGAVVAVSDSTADHLRRTYPSARVRRIYNGVEVEALAELGARVREDDAQRDDAQEPVIAAVGRLVPKKGWDVLLEALALLRARGVPARVALIGSGPQEDELHALAGRLGVGGAVTFSGALPQHEALAVVARSALFATPCVVTPDGDRDGLPTVLLEAMALGTPVVSTPVSGVAEAVTHDSTGLLAEPGDPSSLADRIEDLLQNPALRARCVTGARARAAELFDTPIQARHLAQLTAELSAGGEPETTGTTRMADATGEGAWA